MWFLCQEEFKKLCTRKTLLVFLFCILCSCMITYGITYMKSGYAIQPGEFILGKSAQAQRMASSPQGAIDELFLEAQKQAYTVYTNPAYIQENGILNEQGFFALQAEKPLLTLLSIVKINQDKPAALDDIQQLRQATLMAQFQAQEIPSAMSIAYLAQQSFPDKVMYEDSFSWQMLLSCYPIAAIFFMLYVCIIITPIFSNERSLSVDTLLLSSRNGKQKDIRCKVIATLSFTTITYGVFMTLFMCIHLLLWGMQGKDVLVQLQLEYLFTYPMCSYLEVYGSGVLYGYLASLTITCICLLISSFVQKNESAIIASISVVLLPMTPIAHALPGWINACFPTHLVMLDDLLKSREVYVIFQHILTKQQCLGMISFVLLLGCGVISYLKEGRNCM